jgi:hypothetical protein
MKRSLVGLVLSFFCLGAIAQADGRKNIESLCGCYEVKFKYAETFSPDPDYKYRERDDMSEGLELIVPVEISDKKIILQHLLLISDSMIIKHWREDWTYEEPELWTYSGNMTWSRLVDDQQRAKGKWTQSVWEVSDAPRYQGAGEWVNLDGRTFWQNTSDAPLPRREYTIRKDYNVLKRTNRISLTKEGWVHEQDNQKIIRAEGTDKLLVEEKGWNTYVRTQASKCAAAQVFWDEHKDFWVKVRTGWKEIMADKTSLKIKTTVDGRPLYMHLDDLEKQLAKASSKQSLNTDDAKKIIDLLTKFVEAR